MRREHISYINHVPININLNIQDYPIPGINLESYDSKGGVNVTLSQSLIGID